MKAVFSRDYWQSHWDEMLVKVPGEDYLNLEAQLAGEMKIYLDCGLPAEAIKKIETLMARRIAENAEKVCRREMGIVKHLSEEGYSLGYTTQRQEIEARAALSRRFEFNCYQLSEFRKKYGI